ATGWPSSRSCCCWRATGSAGGSGPGRSVEKEVWGDHDVSERRGPGITEVMSNSSFTRPLLLSLSLLLTATACGAPAAAPPPEREASAAVDAATMPAVAPDAGPAPADAAPVAVDAAAPADAGPPVAEGSPCDDGDACTLDDRWAAGRCQGNLS